MVATTLNDKVMEWGVANGYDHYNQAKDALIAGRTPEAIIAAANATNWNEALYSLADLPAVLREATLWLDAKYSEAGEQVAVNQGTGGSALDAQYGSTTGSDTNDPLFLPHTGENYVALPGVAGNDLYNSTPGTAQVNDKIVITFRSLVAPLRSTGSFQPAVGVGVTTASNTGFLAYLREDGRLSLAGFNDGSATTVSANISGQGPVPTGPVWYRVEMTLTGGPGGNASVSFEYSNDQVATPEGVNWSQFAATVDGGRPGLPFDANTGHNDLTIGSAGFSTSFVMIEIDDAEWLRFDAATDIVSAAATSITPTVGPVLTMRRSTSGRKTALVTRPIWLFGTDDYLEIADNALLDFAADEDFTVLALVRQHGSPTSFARILSKRVGTAAGWALFFAVTNRGSYGVADDGTDEAADIDISYLGDGNLGLYGFKVDRTAETLTAFNDNTASATPESTAAVGAIASGTSMRVGAASTGAPFLDAELVALAVWRRVLDTDEIAEINSYYGTGA